MNLENDIVDLKNDLKNNANTNKKPSYQMAEKVTE